MKTITVTPGDIASGVPHSCSHCPIALALDRAFDDVAYFNVTPEYVRYVWIHEIAICVALPQNAKQFIRDFDNGKKVEPFSFEIVEPHEQNQLST